MRKTRSRSHGYNPRMKTEIELKLTLPRRSLPALRRHPLVASAPRAAPTATLLNTYFDTPTLLLSKHRIALRTRKQGRRWLQTVKADASSSGGLSARPEWEGPYSEAFDFSSIDAAETRKLLEGAAAELIPLFTTDFRRETRRLTPSPGISMLMMIDQGKIAAGDRETPLCEVELELESGRPEDLYRLAIALADELPLLPNDSSKAQRGLELFHNRPALPMRAQPSPVRDTDSPLEAFRKVALDGLRQWQANALGAQQSDDPEWVHQMRVALRRTRSAVKLFAHALPQEFVTHWRGELRDAASMLGEARDIDVLHAELIQPILDDPASANRVEALSALVGGHREAAREHVRDWLSSHHQGARMLRFAAGLEALQGNPLDASAKLQTFAALRLKHLRKRCRDRWVDARGDNIEALHLLRIALKSLRYGLEFFEPLLPPKRLKAYRRRLSAAQKRLGYFNDVAVGRARLAQWAKDDAPLREAVAFVTGWHAPLAKAVRDSILDDTREFLWGRKPW